MEEKSVKKLLLGFYVVIFAVFIVSIVNIMHSYMTIGINRIVSPPDTGGMELMNTKVISSIKKLSGECLIFCIVAFSVFILYLAAEMVIIKLRCYGKIQERVLNRTHFYSTLAVTAVFISSIVLVALNLPDFIRAVPVMSGTGVKKNIYEASLAMESQALFIVPVVLMGIMSALNLIFLFVFKRKDQDL